MNTDANEVTTENVQPGQQLKFEREKKNMTTKQIATALNLPERFIIYLEAGEFNQLPGHTFTRGYIRNYAKYLGLDCAEELITVFDNYVANEPVEAKTLDFKQIKQLRNISNSIYWLISFVICLALVGAVFIVWQSYSHNKGSGAAVAPVVIEPTHSPADDVNTEQPTNNNEAGTTQTNVEHQTMGIPLSEINGGAETNVNTVPLVEQSVAGATEISEPVKEPEAPETTVVVPDGEGHIQATFKSNCWVTVTDATGQVLVNKLHNANIPLDVKGKAPFEVVLGAPNAISLIYNGQPVTIDAKPGSTHHIKLGQ